MELTDVARALRIRWWLPAVGFVVVGVLALTVSLLATPTYTATMRLFVTTTDSASTAEVFQGSQFSQQRVTSYAQLLTGRNVARQVIDRLDLDTSPEELAEQVTATAVPNTVLIDVSVVDPSPERARDIAATIGAVFTDLAADLERPEEDDPSPVRVSVVEPPNLPDEPTQPQTVRNVVLGAVIGLLLGAVGAVAWARFDRRTQDPEEASALAGAPVIGIVARDETLSRRHVFDRDTATRSGEDYRRLRTNLQFLNIDEPPKVIMVSSAVPSEGKTTLAINLALALTETGRRVVVVEGDLRRPRVTKYLGMVGGVGLTNVLAGSADLDEVLQQYGPSNMFVLGAGPTPPNPGELLVSAHMAALLDRMRRTNDFVIIDSPPLLPVADATGLATLVDGVVLSVRHGKTRKEQLRAAAATLERVGARLLGLVLNIVPTRADVAKVYGEGYAYEVDARPTSAAADGGPRSITAGGSPGPSVDGGGPRVSREHPGIDS